MVESRCGDNSRFGAKQDVKSENLREFMYEHVKECTQFKPSVAISVYKLFGKGAETSILDISAGWGDRLISALALPVRKYLATDPNTDLRPGHLKAVQALYNIYNHQSTQSGSCDYQGGAKLLDNHPKIDQIEDFPANYRIIYEPFQTANIPATEKFNLIFTSPPFFDFERYTNKPGQSIDSFPQLNDWLSKFLFVSLEKAWSHLEPSGYMVLHITDVGPVKVCEVMNLYIQSYLPNAEYCGILGTKGSSNKILPMWVWRRNNTSDSNRCDEAKMYMSKFYAGFVKK